MNYTQNSQHVAEKDEASLSPSLNLQILPTECWRPFEVLQGRRQERFSEREIERIPAWVRTQKYPKWTPVRLWDYSAHGFGILFTYHKSYVFSTLIGESIELRLNNGDKNLLQSTCRVSNLALSEKGLRIGLERVLEKGPLSEHLLSKQVLWAQSPSKLKIKIVNPILYNEWCEAEIVAISTGPEWFIQSQDPSLMVFKGMSLKLYLDLPTFNAAYCLAEVLEVYADEKPGICIQLGNLQMPRSLCNSMGEFFMDYENWTPAQLNTCGFRLNEFKEQIHFSFVHTMEEYAQVLQLRRNAYVAAGKKSPFDRIEDSSLELDARSRIVTAKHDDQVIASAVLNFPAHANATLRCENELPQKKFPAHIPPKVSLLEIFSLCTHKDYRHADLLSTFFTNISKIFLLSDRNYIITFVTEELLPVYTRIGFEKTGISIPLASLNNQMHCLILLSRDNMIHGKSMPFTVWSLIYGNIVEELYKRSLLNLKAHEKLLLVMKFKVKDLIVDWHRKNLNKPFQKKSISV